MGSRLESPDRLVQFTRRQKRAIAKNSRRARLRIKEGMKPPWLRRQEERKRRVLIRAAMQADVVGYGGNFVPSRVKL